MLSKRIVPLLAAGAALAAAAPAYAAPSPTLTARTIYPATEYQPGPVSGFNITGDLNGVSLPFGGQPIPGFSALVNAGRGRYYGMADNGFGTKTNSSDFELRTYLVRPSFPKGGMKVEKTITLRDPNRKVPFKLTRVDRVLTGADFDLESLRVARDGTLWFGEEFGPWLLHTSADGVVLDAPFSLEGITSPQNPDLKDPAAATIPGSGGFEGMAASPDGRYLYPMLERAVNNAPDRRARNIYEFDTRAKEYTDRTWTYRVDSQFPDTSIGELTQLDNNRWLVIERDNDQGAEAKHKKIYLVDRRKTEADGSLSKREVVDLLDIADPNRISLPARPGEFGVGNPFSFPLQSIEAVEVNGWNELVVTNDNNFPGSDGRWTDRDRPDDLEIIKIRVPGLRF